MTITFNKKETHFKDGWFTPNRDELAKTFWLIKRDTSVTYIGRMTELLQTFISGFQEFVSKDPKPGAYLTALSQGYGALGQLKAGLIELKNGSPAEYLKIWNGANFGNLFFHGRFVDELDYSPLGKRGDFYKLGHPTSMGLWCWVENAFRMATQIYRISGGSLWYPSLNISEFRYPDVIGGYPLRQGIQIHTGDDIPITGVWEPLNIKSGCPNFFLRGRKAPTSNIAVKKLEDVRTDTDDPNSSQVVFTHYDPGEFPATWELVWEDTRYKDGKIPLEEQEYLLDDYTQFPKDPPVAPGH